MVSSISPAYGMLWTAQATLAPSKWKFSTRRYGRKPPIQFWTVSSKPSNASCDHTLQIDETIPLAETARAARQVAQIGAGKIRALLQRWNATDGAPVFTVAGRYTSRSWTNWTEGFLYGQALLCFEMTGETDLLNTARRLVHLHMGKHATHLGVHDHGFNCVSTY